MEKSYTLAIDQGTSSSRAIIFNRYGEVFATHSVEMELITPKPGWVELDPMDIWGTVEKCLEEVEKEANQKDVTVSGIGITNQRETVVAWDRKTGKPLHNAIVWLDMRTSDLVKEFVAKCGGDKFHFQKKCGLPFSTYFSALKMRWLIDNSEEVRKAIEEKRCLFGTVDTWVIWNLTKELHVTDVTNASRTMLMNLESLSWDLELCTFFGIPREALPEIRSSAEIYGEVKTQFFSGIPISACLGDQQAAVVGQSCFEVGDVKNTYGTGCFMLFNTGSKIVISGYGLLTTVGYKLGKDSETIYALEGSIAVAGVAIKWFRDNMNVIESAKEINDLASKVENTGGLVFVPAFSGLFAPRWEDDARGLAIGITQYTTKEHFARAILEAPCYQTREILDSMRKDSQAELSRIKVDGGMSASDIMLQFQADIVGIDVETTAFGAAFAAGLGVGVWTHDDSIVSKKENCEVFTPRMGEKDREVLFERWNEAVERSLGWASKM